MDAQLNLELLNLSRNQIVKLENLSPLKNLKDLQLANNQIKKIEELDVFKNLESYNLLGNNIEKELDAKYTLFYHKNLEKPHNNESE